MCGGLILGDSHTRACISSFKMTLGFQMVACIVCYAQQHRFSEQNIEQLRSSDGVLSSISYSTVGCII